MKIAVLAWGSLHYDLGVLKIEDNKWFPDGPVLPIEFARISSKSKKLTLVISPAFDSIRTYYGVSLFSELQEAIQNLSEREDTAISNIGYINFKTGAVKAKKIELELKKILSLWNMQHNFDAILWTDLNENFKTALKIPFSLEASINYLRGLSLNEFDKAAAYILEAPPQTTTKHRKALTDFIKQKKLQN